MKPKKADGGGIPVIALAPGGKRFYSKRHPFNFMAATADFTGGGITGLPVKPRSFGKVEVDEQIRNLILSTGCNASCDLIQEMIVTALKIGQDNLSVADLKLFNRSLKEMQTAAKVFSHYTDRPKVAVFGSARTVPDSPDYRTAQAFASRMRDKGFMTITGGGDGIMGAAQEGAGRADSFGLNIVLPFEQSANETILGDEKLITFNYFFTRKLSFVKETQAVALLPGGFGTMDEGFEVITLLQTGKARMIPIVLLDQPGGSYWNTLILFLREQLLARGLISPGDFRLFYNAVDVDDAVRHILRFYRNFVSYRWVRKRLSIRIKNALTAEALQELNRDFADLLAEGEIVARKPLPEEANEPELADLPRLVLSPRRNNFGRLRALIDAINDAAIAPKC